MVFEVLSPKNTRQHMVAKCAWYDLYGAEEFYYLHPRTGIWVGFVRGVAGLLEVPQMNGFVGPRLGMRFETIPGRVGMFLPDGQLFETVEEMQTRRDQAERQVRDLAAEIEWMRREIEQLRNAAAPGKPPE